MPDNILRTGDLAIFDRVMGQAIMLMHYSKALQGSSSLSINGKNCCMVNDEKQVIIHHCVYNAPPYLNGKGILFIESLGEDQQTKFYKIDEKAVILKGSKFNALFVVMSPASFIDSKLILDPRPTYRGQGHFQVNNSFGECFK